MPRPHIVKGRAEEQDDLQYMRHALALAATGLGRVAPNPSVGCVIVSNGMIVGEARSADGGRPHAETQALAMAGDRAKGATVYATLEPCGHFGKTPPCVNALIAAQIARVVIACCDPNQKDNGCIEKLEAAGIAVASGICEDEAIALNEGFFKVLGERRPLVTLKIATSLDGRIATVTGHSQWITGEAARRRVHELRAVHDAVLAGVGTVLADDPQLNVRLPGHDFQPVRIIIDPSLKTPQGSRLAQTADKENLWLVCNDAAPQGKRQLWAGQGAKILPLAAEMNEIIDPRVILKELATQGITRLFIEGGGVTAGHFIKAGLVDRILWFRAPRLIGGDGLAAFGPLGIDTLDKAVNLVLEGTETLGEDLLEIWRIKR